MKTKYTKIWRILAVLCVIGSYLCYRSVGSSNEISMNWSWPIHLLVMVAAGAALFNFIGARNRAMKVVASSQLPASKKLVGKVIVESIAMVCMLILIVPPLIIVNQAGPDFKIVEGTTMFYLSWLGFSVLAVVYFLLLQPIVSTILDKYSS